MTHPRCTGDICARQEVSLFNHDLHRLPHCKPLLGDECCFGQVERLRRFRLRSTIEPIQTNLSIVISTKHSHIAPLQRKTAVIAVSCLTSRLIHDPQQPGLVSHQHRRLCFDECGPAAGAPDQGTGAELP